MYRHDRAYTVSARPKLVPVRCGWAAQPTSALAPATPTLVADFLVHVAGGWVVLCLRSEGGGHREAVEEVGNVAMHSPPQRTGRTSAARDPSSANHEAVRSAIDESVSLVASWLDWMR